MTVRERFLETSLGFGLLHLVGCVTKPDGEPLPGLRT